MTAMASGGEFPLRSLRHAPDARIAVLAQPPAKRRERSPGCRGGPRLGGGSGIRRGRERVHQCQPSPHPVKARNGGIVATCRRWLEKRPGGCTLLAELNDQDHRFETVAALLAGAMDGDPALGEYRRLGVADPDYNKVRARFAAPPLMFWSRPHAFIETTAAPDRMLIASDLGDDLPADLLRPPFPACYLSFGPAVGSFLAPDDYWPGVGPARPRGAYVFQTTRDSMRTLGLVAILDLPGESTVGITYLDLLIADEAQPLNRNIQLAISHEAAGDRSSDLALVQTVAKVLLYMASPGAAIVEERRSSEALRKV